MRTAVGLVSFHLKQQNVWGKICEKRYDTYVTHFTQFEHLCIRFGTIAIATMRDMYGKLSIRQYHGNKLVIFYGIPWSYIINLNSCKSPELSMSPNPVR